MILKKQRIIDAHLANPSLTRRELARIAECSLGMVYNTVWVAGLRPAPDRPGVSAEAVIRLRRPRDTRGRFMTGDAA